ncbi:MAG: lysophospholipid acyltransferase family protein [Myxococcota bacterium]|nr:lysophospholipid acyltransferase family protein [Myxococcota bacterium]MEC8425102.1 lysophospholipid acyltransferase family protein [Myxococcota bacterium]
MMPWLLGWIWWLVLPVRRKLAVQNHQAAFPERHAGELRRTVGELAWSYVELAAGRRARVEGLEGRSSGALVLAGHFSGWDLALLSLADHTPVTIFVRQPSDQLARAVVARLRTHPDLELLPPRGAMERAYAALAEGRLVLFVQDQRHEPGIAVPFLGRSAWTSAGFAVAAWRTRAPVFGMVQYRDEDGQHVVHLRPLELDVPDDRGAAVGMLTAASQQFYEAVIRARPWTWWWLHDRWRRPPDAIG